MAQFTNTSAQTIRNTEDVITGLLTALRVPVARATVRQALLSHPAYPSMLALSDALADWQVDSAALQLNTTEQLRELPLPLIACLKSGPYVLVTGLRGDMITFANGQQNRVRQSLAKFEEQWTGVVLVAEQNASANETSPSTLDKLTFSKRWGRPVLQATMILMVALILVSVGPSLTRLGGVWLMTKTLGLGLSVLLVGKTLYFPSTVTDRLCQLGGAADCDALLHSPAARLGGWLSWADVGLLYFASSLLMTLLAMFLPAIWPLIAGMALLSLPYAFFSIYYQARVARQWCVLCLLVQGVVLLEGGLAVMEPLKFSASGQVYLLTTIAVLLPLPTWLLIRPLLVKVGQGQRHYEELMMFRRNPDLFRALLEQLPPMPPVTDDIHPVLLGNPDATHTITMVTSPYCGPCARKHQELEALMHQHQDVKIQVVFACDGPNGPGTRVALHIIALKLTGAASTALADWFAQPERKYEQWAKRYPLFSAVSEGNSIAERCHQWCRQAAIIKTPTLFIDGFPLPELYQVADALRMIRFMNSLSRSV